MTKRSTKKKTFSQRLNELTMGLSPEGRVVEMLMKNPPPKENVLVKKMKTKRSTKKKMMDAYFRYLSRSWNSKEHKLGLMMRIVGRMNDVVEIE